MRVICTNFLYASFYLFYLPVRAEVSGRPCHPCLDVLRIASADKILAAQAISHHTMSDAFYTSSAHAFEDVEVGTPAEAGPSSMGDAASSLDAAFEITTTAQLILDGAFKTVRTVHGWC